MTLGHFPNLSETVFRGALFVKIRIVPASFLPLILLPLFPLLPLKAESLPHLSLYQLSVWQSKHRGLFHRMSQSSLLLGKWEDMVSTLLTPLVLNKQRLGGSWEIRLPAPALSCSQSINLPHACLSPGWRLRAACLLPSKLRAFSPGAEVLRLSGFPAVWVFQIVSPKENPQSSVY